MLVCFSDFWIILVEIFHVAAINTYVKIFLYNHIFIVG